MRRDGTLVGYNNFLHILEAFWKLISGGILISREVQGMWDLTLGAKRQKVSEKVLVSLIKMQF